VLGKSSKAFGALSDGRSSPRAVSGERTARLPGTGTYRYQGHQELWTELRMRMREIAQSRVRQGFANSIASGIKDGRCRN
jgi:hypothetical protein